MPSFLRVNARYKYGNIPTIIDGIRFSSKLEGKRFSELCLLKRAGEIKFFMRQIPFYLPGSQKYVCDFMVFHNDGTISVEDCKGKILPAFWTKKAFTEQCYPVTIVIVTKKGRYLTHEDYKNGIVS